jgi:hypothetical protein
MKNKWCDTSTTGFGTVRRSLTSVARKIRMPRVWEAMGGIGPKILERRECFRDELTLNMASG